jgi:hypothetical protein
MLPSYQKLKAIVDAKIEGKKSPKWHYESRVKELISFAIKLQTGRERYPRRSEDMFACTLVVENHSKIQQATDLVTKLFKEEYRRPKDAKTSSLSSDTFAFDDLRLYAQWEDVPSMPPTLVNGLLFEIQIKTYLQHAWGIATHDLIYKTNDPNWGRSRVAYQVKAMLENAELSISEVKRLTDCVFLDRADRATNLLSQTIQELKARWAEPGTLPADIQGLANNIIGLAARLKIDLQELWRILDAATMAGKGARRLDLSPYGSILEALIEVHQADLFNPLGHPKNRHHVFVPRELAMPARAPEVKKWIVQP